MAMSPRMSADELWETYLMHLSFSQLGWLFQRFRSDAVNDELTTSLALQKHIQSWLEHQWPGCLSTYDVNDDMLKAAMESISLPINFFTFFRVVLQYQSMHIENEDNAGFDPDEVAQLKIIFENHHRSCRGPGLQGKALFAVLEDLGIQFQSKEERLWYVDTVQKLDKNRDGTINFPELCQIIRKVEDMDAEKKRLREFTLVKKSGLPFDEVEDWYELFNENDSDGSGELQRHHVRDLITSIGVTWDKDMAEAIGQWVHEADENNNGTVDFGEFCIVISKLWATNLHDVRNASRKFMGREMVSSLKSVSGKFISASSDGQVVATSTEIGANETFTMIRLQSGNVILQSVHGPCLSVDIDDLRCKEGSRTEFKVKTLEDERVILTASTAAGGILFANDEGKVGISDGNPADKPYFPFTVTLHETLVKKNWSRVKPPKKTKRRRPSKMSVPAKGAAEEDPTSPGLKEAIALMDEALNTSRSMGEGT
mmetsp:Transcript_37613/g.66856  ORF Transcript_37613/g.66856 Transcript_37613/m.66856 type:complete len:484 (-) Transcript_37613:127-1578(-)